MIKPLASFLVLLAASAAFAATPLENAAAIAAQLGATVSFEPATIAAPAAQPAAAKSAAPAAVKIAELAGASGSVSGYATASGNGSMNCSGGPRGGGMISGW